MDPRNRPALDRAMPGDDVPGGEYREERRTWTVLFGDGEWHPVTVMAWRADRHGRGVVDVEYWDWAELTTRTGSYLADPERMREG